MNGVLQNILAPLVLSAAFTWSWAGSDGSSPLASREETRSVLIVVDGLRPDYITSELMPNLFALGERGVFGETHSAVFPTYTRANSPSIGTGSYPRTHGVLHNHMYHPAMGDGSFSTGDAQQLMRFDELTDGQLITTVSLGEALEREGQRLFVTGSGGSGTTLLQNPRATGLGIWHGGGLFLPESARQQAVRAVGEPPEDRPSQSVWAVDAYLHQALSDDPPEVTILWFNDIDSAAHANGIGAPATLEAAANVDGEIGRIVRTHEEHGLTDQVNIFVTSDHGFSTTTGGFDVARILEEQELGTGVMVFRNMIYLEDDRPELLQPIAEALQRDETVGNIYSRPVRPGASEGILPGTLSTEVIEWNHERSADMIVSPAWTNDVNEYGYAGTTSFGGTATHGSDSPFDLQIRLVAAGPDIKSNVRSHVPTSNVDFAPTILYLLGLQPPESMDGRVMHELLNGGPDPEDVRVHEHVHRAAISFPDGFRYEASLEVLRVGSASYLRGAATRREASSP